MIAFRAGCGYICRHERQGWCCTDGRMEVAHSVFPAWVEGGGLLVGRLASSAGHPRPGHAAALFAGASGRRLFAHGNGCAGASGGMGKRLAGCAVQAAAFFGRVAALAGGAVVAADVSVARGSRASRACGRRNHGGRAGSYRQRVAGSLRGEPVRICSAIIIIWGRPRRANVSSEFRWRLATFCWAIALTGRPPA
jgi:hypothetical protein